jgi:hypothetical protein
VMTKSDRKGDSMSDEKTYCGNCDQGAKAQGDPERQLLSGLSNLGYVTSSMGDPTHVLNDLGDKLLPLLPPLDDARAGHFERIAALEAENAKLKEAIEAIVDRINNNETHGGYTGLPPLDAAELLKKGEPHA